MLDHALNDSLSRVGQGTPMGETMRRYWLPSLLSTEIPEPDCPPVRVALMGESLLAFRDTNGLVGLVQEACPHRRASLYFGRNEECGIRCVYHGWKFDVDGNCVDQMNEPRQFNDQVKITAYPTLDMGGVIWAYLGPPDKKPAPPEFELTKAPETHRYMTKVWQECNWLQAMEGGIDTSHAPILHRKLTDDTDEPGISPNSPFLQGAAPDVEVETTDYGYRYFGIRPIGDDQTFVRGYQYVMPFTQLRPSRYGKEVVDGHFWVPMDDYNVMVYNFGYSWGADPLPENESALKDSGNNLDEDVDPTNGFRSIRNRDNNYMLDRDVQKTQTFTGIHGINAQDRAIQESMGSIVDRTLEFLGPSDIAIVAARKLLEQAMDIVKDDGEPLGVAPTYYNVRAAEGMYSKGEAWRESLLSRMHP